MANNPKDQHFVPRVHLKRFADQNGHLWHFDKTKLKKGVEPRNPKSIFWLKHHNTLIGENNEKNFEIELELSKIETCFSDISEELIKKVLGGIDPSSDHESCRFMRQYFQLQYRRTPDREASLAPLIPDNQFHISTLKKTMQREIGIEFTDSELSIFIRYNNGEQSIMHEHIAVYRKLLGEVALNKSDGEIANLLESEIAKNAAASGKIAARYAPIREVDHIFGKPNMWFVRLGRNNSFLVGSSPIALTNQKINQKGSPLSGAVFPLSSSVAMVLGPSDWPYRLENVDDKPSVRTINTIIANQSTSFASQTRNLTRSFAGKSQPYIPQTSFGS